MNYAGVSINVLWFNKIFSYLFLKNILLFLMFLSLKKGEERRMLFWRDQWRSPLLATGSALVGVCSPVAWAWVIGM